MFSKPNAIIYVRRTGLIVAGKRLTPARLSFDTAQIDNMEVIDSEGFVSSCQKFFEEHDLHGKHILMVLDDSLVFTKSADLEQANQSTAIRDSFVDIMPFAPGNRACLSVVSQKHVELYATNPELYQYVAEAIHRAGAGRLLAITPASAYDTADAKQLAAAIQHYVNDTSVRAAANFQSASPV
jgi:hypothetical protein